MTPTQRSLAWLRKLDYLAAVTERWNPHVRIRQDLFGFVDVLAVRGDEVLAIQTTTTAIAARIAKAKALPEYEVWLRSPHRRVEFHSWRRVGARGKRKLWALRRIDGRTLENIE